MVMWKTSNCTKKVGGVVPVCHGQVEGLNGYVHVDICVATLVAMIVGLVILLSCSKKMISILLAISRLDCSVPPILAKVTLLLAININVTRSEHSKVA